MAAGNLSKRTESDASQVITLSKRDASALAALRLEPGVEIAEVADLIWVRARQPGGLKPDRLLVLPALERFEWLDGDRLRRVGSLIPCDKIPPLHWQAVASWIKLQFPPASLPAGNVVPIRIGLVRSDTERKPGALLTTMESWVRFGAEAPEVRLAGLQFAVNDSGEVLVLGEPLPPLPGKRFCIQENIAVPAGFDWRPALEAEVLRRKLGMPVDCMILFHEDGTFSRIQVEQRVVASRSAIRATAAAFEEKR